jgi:chaperone modulatory protein CbpM
VTVARTACRLRDDFELDTSGLSVALTLLQRVRTLEEELARLRAQFPAS